jgi:16S rRNA (uracil1498-N3)-methyltransferase
MRRLICKKIPSAGNRERLTQGESHHAFSVLRLASGAVIEAIDKTSACLARITKENDEVWIEFVSEVTKAENETLPLTLEMAILKKSNMDLVVEKCVELGVKTIVPVLTKRTIVDPKRGLENHIARWNRIAEQSLKQCGRRSALIIQHATSLNDLVSRPQKDIIRIWCDEDAGYQPNSTLLSLASKIGSNPVHLLIGPEGGWDPSERQKLESLEIEKVSLGPLTLRAETAAISAVSVIVQLWSQKGFRHQG